MYCVCTMSRTMNMKRSWEISKNFCRRKCEKQLMKMPET